MSAGGGETLTSKMMTIAARGDLAAKKRRLPKKIGSLQGNPGLLERLEHLARSRGYDLNEKLAEVLVLNLEDADRKTQMDAFKTALNIQGAHSGKYPHIAPANVKLEVTSRLIPTEFANMSVERLQDIVMGVADAEIVEEFESKTEKGE